MHYLRETVDICPRNCADQCPHDHLALNANIDDSRLKRNGESQTGEHQRRRFAEDQRDAHLGAKRTPEDSGIDVKRRIARNPDHDCNNDERRKKRQRRDFKLVERAHQLLFLCA
ncbi:hypothetical protein SDC9_163055 [bioreactor metagenome]|uniref:Uncharacterized protein n=1 Tax=bioreactor metagenome TaxID=1076179 RepID=A0A645FMU7_9ZZZZ